MTGYWITEKEKHNNIELIINNKRLFFNDYRQKKDPFRNNVETDKLPYVSKIQK
jgi:hypothetical protein